MTICRECKPWAATTRRMLANRIANMIDGGQEVTIHRCPKCGGTEWATTDRYVASDGEAWMRSWGYGIAWGAIILAIAMIIGVLSGVLK